MSWNTVLLGATIAFVAWRMLSGLLARRRLPELLRQGAQVIDVRSAAEFAAGHAAQSRNVPLEQLATEAGTLDRNRWIIVCCASGTRSGLACRRLKGQGFTQVLNAGSWRNLP